MKNLIVDIASGIRVEQDLTSEEIAEREARQAEEQARVEAEAQAKASAVAKLEALGLTLDEVKVAFGLEVE